MNNKTKIFTAVSLLVLFSIAVIFFSYYIGDDRITFIKTFIIQSVTNQAIENDVPPEIKRKVEHYIKQHVLRNAMTPEDCFVNFDYYGMSRKRNLINVYGWNYYNTFKFVDKQIMDPSGSSHPEVIYLKETEKGISVIGIHDGMKPRDYIEVFPKSMWHKIFGRNEGDNIMKIIWNWGKPIPPGAKYRLHENPIKDMQDQIITFYRDKMLDDRFVIKTKPLNINDPHKHGEDIYNYYNLKIPYEKIQIKDNPDKIIGGDPVCSPDCRFKAWIGVDQKNHLFFKDEEKNIVYEVINVTNDRQSELAWKDDHTLVFDQINSFGRIGRHGVHIELDVIQKKIVWAVPFGELGFPKKLD